MTRPAPAFSACLVPGGEDDGQERWLEHWDVARSARASVTCVVTGLVPEPFALYPLDSDRVVLMLCFAPELRTAAAGWTVLTEIPTNSVRATALASWGMWERRRTECVLSVRRQVQSGVIGVDTVIYLRLYGQICASANVCGDRSLSGQVIAPSGRWPAALESRAQADTRRVETLAFLLIPEGALKGAGLASFF